MRLINFHEHKVSMNTWGKVENDNIFVNYNEPQDVKFFVWVGNKNGPFGGWGNEDLLL